MKKDTIQSESERRLELLEKHFKVDRDQKIIHLTFHYENASALLDTSIGNPENPFIQEEILEKISSLVSDLPPNYFAEISISIDDYEGYESKKLLSALNDSLELSHYRFEKQEKTKWLSSTLMVLVGIIVLLFMFIGNEGNWFGKGQIADLIVEVLDIVGCVFIWEAVCVIFLSPNELRIMTRRIQIRTKKISFADREGKVLAVEEQESFCLTPDRQKASFHVWQKMLLFSSGALLGFSSALILRLIATLTSIPPEIVGADRVQYIFWWIFLSGSITALCGGAGLLGLSYYNSKKKKPLLTLLFGGGLFLIILSSLLTTVILGRGSSSSYLLMGSGLLIDLCYMIGAYHTNRDKREPEKE